MLRILGVLAILICWFGYPSKALTLSVEASGGGLLGREVFCVWTANSTDPETFTLWWDLVPLPIPASVTRNNESGGRTSLGILSFIEPFTVFARAGPSDTGAIIAQTVLKAVDAGSSTAMSYLQLPANHYLGTNTQPATRARLEARPVIRTFSESGIVMGTSSVTSSVNGTNRTSGFDIAALIGAILAGLICLVLGALGIWILLRRRRRELNLVATPFESTSSEHLSPIRAAQLFSSKPRSRNQRSPDIEQFATEKPEMEPVVLASVPRSQARVSEIDRRREESEVAPNSLPGSPEAMRALITENTRLQSEIQVLRDRDRSDWALRATDVPPSYPHSEESS
ncbi:hypothetical protein C8J56DRAFT_1052416 [Mycena floridula]|nr:hypothetical protein C8J56DRAFT_1052416 [Mycena floridula]